MFNINDFAPEANERRLVKLLRSRGGSLTCTTAQLRRLLHSDIISGAISDARRHGLVRSLPGAPRGEVRLELVRGGE